MESQQDKGRIGHANYFMKQLKKINDSAIKDDDVEEEWRSAFAANLLILLNATNSLDLSLDFFVYATFWKTYRQVFGREKWESLHANFAVTAPSRYDTIPCAVTSAIQSRIDEALKRRGVYKSDCMLEALGQYVKEELESARTEAPKAKRCFSEIDHDREETPAKRAKTEA